MQIMTKSRPRITVITVVYNADRYLEDTIRSVLAQSYENLSFIIIDGGSTDTSVDIIKRYQDKLLYWISEKDRGIYDAMNKGWAAAADDGYILFLGAGDKLISLPGNRETLAESDVIYGTVRIGGDKIFISKVGPLLKVFNTLHHQALLVRKSILKDAPFDLRYKLYADFDLNQRLYKSKVKFQRDDSLIAYALPGGASDAYDYRESFAIIRKNFGLFWSLCFVLLYFVSLLWSSVAPFKPFSAVRPHRHPGK